MHGVACWVWFHHMYLLLLLLLLLPFLLLVMHVSENEYYFYCTFLQMPSHAAMRRTVQQIFLGSVSCPFRTPPCTPWVSKLIVCCSIHWHLCPFSLFPTITLLLSFLLVSCQLCLFKCWLMVGWGVLPPWCCLIEFLRCCCCFSTVSYVRYSWRCQGLQ